MGSIAQLGVPADEFALRETLPRVPWVEVEVERIVAHEADHVMPFLWVAGDDLDAFEDALADDPTVANEECISELDDGRFYQMHWVDHVDMLVHSITRHEAAILDARGRADHWSLRVLFPRRDSVSQTHDFCQGRGLTVEVDSVYELTGTKRYGQFGLTENQHEALVAALRRGYYEVPRRTSARELAAELGVTHQALSERLRRGHGNLVTNALVADVDRPLRPEK